MVSKILFVVHFYLLAYNAYSYENMYGPLYGEEWMLMTGDDGYPYYVDFTQPNENNTEQRFISGDPYFYLYTRSNRNEPEQLTASRNEPITSEYFNASNAVKAITHGWMSTGDTEWILDFKDAYLRKFDVNVIAVDWGGLARNPVYPLSALATRHVGRKVAQLIDGLQESYGVGADKVHLLGHSLGAQVMGYAGSFSTQNVSRITGMDPARPLFERPATSDERRLDQSDAEFVDIIHTCGGLLGYRDSHGHADFYPNGGTAEQPGCEGLQNVLEACSHGRSYQFYTESIESQVGFVSYRCDSQDEYREGNCRDGANLMGEFTDRSLSGDFYLDTNDQYQYAKGAE